ncbi:MAG: glycosyltransferase family 39 protein [Candidatus Hinthialibacter antarcticus]|nr:glycosyltransferase family 39 protein [Candidatus Hinthialibacter antarcticus]
MNDQQINPQQKNDTKRILHWVCLAIVLFMALWLRLDGSDWGLPFRLHPDEWKYVSAGANVHAGEWNPKYFRNPPGFSYMNAAWFPVWLRIAPTVEIPEWYKVGPLASPSMNPAQALIERPYQLVYGARALAAILGTLTVLLVYGLGRELGCKRLALLAALFAAVSFVAVRESHFAVNDAAACFWATLSLYVGMRAVRLDSKRTFYFAAVIAGVAVAMKYNMFPAVIALAVMREIDARSKGKSQPVQDIFKEIVFCLGLAGCGFLLVCPFPFIDPQMFFAEIDKLRVAAVKPWPGQDRSWSGWQLLKSVVLSEGVLTSLLALYGAYVWVREKKWTPFIFFAGYFFLVATHPLFFVRFTLPVLPWVALFAACGALMLAEKLPKKTMALCVVAAICLVEPLAKDLRSNWLFHQTDTRILCLEWLAKERPDPGYIAGGQFTLPLPYRTNQPPWGAPADPRHITIDQLASQELWKLDQFDKPVNCVLVSSYDSFPGFIPGSLAQRRRAVQAYVGSRNPVAVFNPFRYESVMQDANVEDTYHPVTQLWQRQRPGPMIEAYVKQK